MDIFEDLKNYVGCSVISDLRYEPHKGRAKVLLREINLSKYSLQSLNDVAAYLYDTDLVFQSVADVQHFFRSNA